MKWASLITGLWVAAVAGAWWCFVPFAPEYVFDAGIGGPFPVGPDQVLTCESRPKSPERPRIGIYGPAAIRDVRTGSILRTMLTDDDQIVAFDFETRQRLAIRRNNQLRVIRIADVAEEAVISEAGSPNSIFQFAAFGRLLLIGELAQVRAFDTLTGELKWRQKGAALTRSPQGPRVVVLSESNGSTIGAGMAYNLSACRLVDPETGEPHAALGGVKCLPPVYSSRDGRFIVFRTSTGRSTVYGVDSGRALWELSEQLSRVSLLWFSDDGAELHVPYRTPDGQAGIARWSAVDGSVLESFPNGAANAELRLSEDGRYAFELRQHQRFPAAISNLFRGQKLGSLGELTGPFVAPVMIDLKEQRILGRLASDQRWVNNWNNAPGFFCRRTDGSRIAYYTFPPGRNWTWLIGWGLIPPAVVWGCWRFWKRWRTSLPTLAASARQDVRVDHAMRGREKSRISRIKLSSGEFLSANRCDPWFLFRDSH